MSEKKSILARLMANENIEVRHGSYETAFFDVKQRLLGLPMWNDSEVYDLLIGHEVGHALVGKLLPNTDPVHKISIISRG